MVSTGMGTENPWVTSLAKRRDTWSASVVADLVSSGKYCLEFLFFPFGLGQ